MADRIEGLGELRKTVLQFKADVKDKAARRIVAAGGATLRTEARIVAHTAGLQKTGALIRNIAIKRERSAPEGTEQYNLGVRHGRDLGNGKKVTKYLAIESGRVVVKRANDPFYWRFVHFGTKLIQGVRFLEIALANKKDAALAAMTERAEKELLKQ